MHRARDRNFTARLPTALLRRLKEESAADGVSMNAYLERVLAAALSGNRNDAREAAVARLLAGAKEGLYDMDRPLKREEAHERHA